MVWNMSRLSNHYIVVESLTSLNVFDVSWCHLCRTWPYAACSYRFCGGLTAARLLLPESMQDMNLQDDKMLRNVCLGRYRPKKFARTKSGVLLGKLIFPTPPKPACHIKIYSSRGIFRSILDKIRAYLGVQSLVLKPLPRIFVDIFQHFFWIWDFGSSAKILKKILKTGYFLGN